MAENKLNDKTIAFFDCYLGKITEKDYNKIRSHDIPNNYSALENLGKYISMAYNFSDILNHFRCMPEKKLNEIVESYINKRNDTLTLDEINKLKN